MTNNLISFASTTTFMVVLFSIVLTGESQTFATSLPRSALQIKRQNPTHLHFYFQEVSSGPNATAIPVASAPITNISPSSFGLVIVDDNLLTVGPELNSTRVGRSQGMYAASDVKDTSLMMVQNFVFDGEKFNGSTLSILGRNPIFASVREMPVVGGSGVFRFATGYAEARTYFINTTSKNVIVEYDVYVLH